MRWIILALTIALTSAGWAQPLEADRQLLNQVVEYGHSNLDETTGLITDTAGTPNIAEASIGYVAACFAVGTEIEQARNVLAKILDQQAADGPMRGHFPWSAGGAVGEEAVLYMTPLLAWIAVHHAGELGAPLHTRLLESLELIRGALGRISVTPADDHRYIARAAALAAVDAAAGSFSPAPQGMVREWLANVRVNGLPAGHSPTFDAVRLVSLKWLREFVAPPVDSAVDQALLLTALDMALRADPVTRTLNGASRQTMPGEYLFGTGFGSYILYTDFGLAPPSVIDPYITAALLPAWRAPSTIANIVMHTGSRMVRTLAHAGPVAATETYIGPGFSLGTMSGQVDAGTIPVFAAFGAAAARPTLYFYASPLPAHVRSVQDQGLALCSFNFDRIGGGTRRQAFIQGVLGEAADISDIHCYGVEWNDQPTAVGERETITFKTRAAYVGLTVTRTGDPFRAEGPASPPATLQWDGEGRSGNLLLTIYARQAEYTLPKPMDHVRAGVVVEIAPLSAFDSIEAFSEHVGRGRISQSAKDTRQRVEQEEKPAVYNVPIPRPRSRMDMIFRQVIEHTIEYTNGERSLKLVEDLLAERILGRWINGEQQSEDYLWHSPVFTFKPGDSFDTLPGSSLSSD